MILQHPRTVEPTVLETVRILELVCRPSVQLTVFGALGHRGVHALRLVEPVSDSELENAIRRLLAMVEK